MRRKQEEKIEDWRTSLDQPNWAHCRCSLSNSSSHQILTCTDLRKRRCLLAAFHNLLASSARHIIILLTDHLDSYHIACNWLSCFQLGSCLQGRGKVAGSRLDTWAWFQSADCRTGPMRQSRRLAPYIALIGHSLHHLCHSITKDFSEGLDANRKTLTGMQM